MSLSKQTKAGIAAARPEAERGLRAYLKRFKPDTDSLDTLPGFKTFAGALFDGGAAAYTLETPAERHAVERFLREELIFEVIEQMSPARGLAEAKGGYTRPTNFSVEIRPDEVPLAVDPDGKPLDPDAQRYGSLIHSPHGDIEFFLDNVGLPSKLGPDVLEKFLFAIRAHLETRVFWWAARMTADAQGQPSPAPVAETLNAEQAMPGASPTPALVPGPLESILSLQTVGSISQSHRSRLEGELRIINSKLIEREIDEQRSLRDTYDAVAETLFECGESLSDERLTESIPVLVFEIALEFGWVTRQQAERDSYHWSGATSYRNPPPIPDPAAALGGHKVQEVFKAWLLATLRGRIEHWRGFARKNSVIQPAQVATKTLQEPAPFADERSGEQPDPQREMALGYRDVAATAKPDKGNVRLLQAGGEYKRAVSLDVACRYGGVTRRAIEDAAKRGSLQTKGKRTHRKVLVVSLLEYFPPEK
jgi:hypothetical protein